jgi:peroxiredoxin
MALEYSTPSELGSTASAFTLPGVDGKNYSLNDFKSAQGLLVIFMCNHCPYVIAVHERLNQLAKDFSAQGIAVIGINSNDPNYREADSFENMKKTAKEWNLIFPYVFDESQSVARAYDAVCTPDPYLYENLGHSQGSADFRLRYRGRIDDSWKETDLVKEQSLRLAIQALVNQEAPNSVQIPSMGCSIKWKKN